MWRLFVLNRLLCLLRSMLGKPPEEAFILTQSTKLVVIWSCCFNHRCLLQHVLCLNQPASISVIRLWHWNQIKRYTHLMVYVLCRNYSSASRKQFVVLATSSVLSLLLAVTSWSSRLRISRYKRDQCLQAHAGWLFAGIEHRVRPSAASRRICIFVYTL